MSGDGRRSDGGNSSDGHKSDADKNGQSRVGSGGKANKYSSSECDGNNKDGTSIAADPAAWIDALQTNGLPVSILQQAPLLIEGPLTAPFGKARILFLDERMRILRTQQNFVAVNVRSDPEWF